MLNKYDSVLDILKTFKDHRGRKGRRGGSVARDSIGEELFDNIKIKLQIPSYEEYELNNAMNSLFGKKLGKSEVAGLIGAPSGSTIRLSAVGDSIEFHTTHPFFEGEQERILHKEKDGLVMDNNSFHLKPEAPQGFGTRIFANQISNMQKLGVSKITTFAGGEAGENINGYYTWARLGYSNREKLSTFNKNGKGFEKEGDIQKIMSTSEGRKWWKENGSGFQGEFNLSPNSKSMKILKAYVKEKGYYFG